MHNEPVKKDIIVLEANWHRRLRECRLRAGSSRRTLATDTGLSVASIKAYEIGARRPSLDALETVLDVLAVPQTLANWIRLELRYPPRADQDLVLTDTELSAAIVEAPWPALVFGTRFEVTAHNAPAAAVLRIAEFGSAFVPNVVFAIGPEVDRAEILLGLCVGMWSRAVAAAGGNYGSLPEASLSFLPSEWQSLIQSRIGLLAPRRRHHVRIMWRPMRDGSAVQFVIAFTQISDHVLVEWIPWGRGSFHRLRSLLESPGELSSRIGHKPRFIVTASRIREVMR